MTPESPALLRLQAALARPKPGLASQLKMVPDPRPGQQEYTEVERTSLKAGVMVLLYPKEFRSHLVFIRRPDTVLHHKAQISFPGGQLEPGEDAVRAALRETREEIGVSPELIRVLGELTPLFIPPSNFIIYPIVGAMDSPVPFKPFPREVAEIIEVPLGFFQDAGNVRVETRTIRGEAVRVPYYGFGPHKIWGATAMVLAEFLDVLGPDGLQ